MAVTFLDLQTRVGELINQALVDDTKTVTLTEVKANLNIGYRKVINAVVSTNENFYVRLKTADLLEGQSIYTLPDDARKLRRLEVGYESSGTRYPSTRLDRNNNPDPSGYYSEIAPVHYIVGDILELNPVPSMAVEQGLWLWCVENPGDMINPDDAPDLPLGYQYLPVHYAVAKAKERLGLSAEAKSFINEFNVDIDIMKDENILRSAESNEFVKITDPY